MFLLFCGDNWFTGQGNSYPPPVEHAWPMFQHDAQHTGMSPFDGPKYHRIKWKLNIGGGHSAPAVDMYDTVYLGSEKGGLYAVNPDGSIKWKFPTSGSISSSPALDKVGNIYFGCRDRYFYSINKKGTLRWKYNTEMEKLVRINPIIGDDGMIYVVADSAYAFYSSGKIKWKIPLSKYMPTHHRGTPAIDHRGFIYMCLDSESLSVVKPDGSILKKIPNSFITISSPSIDGNDNVYYASFSDGNLYALNENGEIKWKKQVVWMTSGSPALSEKENTIYWPLRLFLVALNFDGSVKWDWFTNDQDIQFGNSPILDSCGNIYVGGGNYLFIFSPKGELIDKIQLEDHYISSPVLSYTRVLYITDYTGYLYAIE